jgi:hypothetical protein
MRTLKHAFFYFGLFFMSTFFWIKCQKDTEPIKQEKQVQTELTTRALGDTLFIPISYGGELKVYPNTIVRCRNKKTGKFEYQALMSGDQRLPACGYQQVNYHDKVNISDTGLIRPIDTFYICRRVIK